MQSDQIRVLLVEDNRADAVLVQELLNDQPDVFTVVWVDRLAKAVDLSGRESFDAILLDLSLPDSSGMDTLAGIIRAMPSVAIVVVTGLSDEEVAIKAIRGGAQDYLVKDHLSCQTIARSIRHAIGRKRAERGFRILSETAGRLLAAENPQTVVEELCREVMRHLDCQVFFNYLAEEEDSGHQSLVNGHQSLVNGHQSLVNGHLSLGREGSLVNGHSSLERGESLVNSHLSLMTDDAAKPQMTNDRSPMTNDAPQAPMTNDQSPMSPRLRLNAYAGIPDEDARRIEILTFGSAVCGCVARDGVRIVAEDIGSVADPRTDLAKSYGVKAYCCHPLVAQGRVIGTLSFGTKTRTRFDDDDLAVMKTVADQVAMAMQRVMNMREIERAKDAVATMTAARTAMDTLEAMGEGLVVADRKGMVRSMNAAMTRLSGYGSGETVGKSLAELLSAVVKDDDLTVFIEALDCAMRGEVVTVPPVVIMAKDGRRIAVAPAVSFIRGAGGRMDGIVLTLRDISELRAAHRAVEESERKYRELVENANSIIMRRRSDGTITFFNEYAQKFFGFTADEVLGRNILGAIVPSVDSEGRDMTAMIREISADPDLHASNENENVCKDGRRVWVHWTNKAVRDGQGNVREILCVGSDITARRLMEVDNRRYQERLRSLAERLAASEEQDRWRISRYIHDTIVQSLSLASTQLGSMAERLADSSMAEERERVGRTRRAVDQAIEECRMVMADLTPALLYELGLVAALNELAQRTEEKHGAIVRIEDDGVEVPIENSLRGLLFESTRELVMNALKHGGKCEVRVSVKRRGNDVVVRVADNGKGFLPTAAGTQPGRQGGFGLFSIRQRVEGLGGSVEIESVLGKGTTATISAPVG